MSCLQTRPLLLLLFAVLAGLAVASAQEEAPLTVAQVEEKIAAVEAMTELAEADRTRVLENLRAALAELRRAEDFTQTAALYKQQSDQAPGDLAEVQRKLGRMSEEVEVTPPADSTVAELDLQHVQAQVDLVDYQARLQQLKDEETRRAERRRQIPEEIAQKRAAVSAVQPQPIASGGPPVAGEAAALLVQAQRKALAAETDTLLKELLSYEARGRLLSRQIDLATLELRRQEARVKAWMDLATKARQEEARRETEVARAAAEETRKAIIDASRAGSRVREVAEQLADENDALVAERSGPDGLMQRIEEAQARQATLQEIYTKLDAAASELQNQSRKAETRQAGLAEPLGRVLREQREQLPDERLYRKRARQTESALAEVDARIITLETERASLNDIEELVRDALEEATVADGPGQAAAPGDTASPDSADPSVPAEAAEDGAEGRSAELEALLRDLYEAKRDSVQAVLSSYTNYASQLVTLAEAQRRLANRAEEVRAYIDERVLWIRSGSRVAFGDVKNIYAGLKWLLAPAGWNDLSKALLRDFGRAPTAWLMPLLILLVLGSLHRRIRHRLKSIEKAVSKRTCSHITPTLEASFYAALMPLPVVLVPAVFAWRTAADEEVLGHGLAVGAGLHALALLAATIALPRQVLRPHGLGPVHFGWPEGACVRLRKSLLTTGAVLAPLVFLVAALNASGQTELVQEAGRAFYLAALLALAVPMQRCLNRARGPVWDILAQTGRRAARFTVALVWAIWAALFTAALMGYYYTAERLTGQLHVTLCFALAVFWGYSLALRWLLMARRRLAMEQARLRREQLKREEADTSEDAVREAELIDLTQVDTQTRRLLRSAVAFTLALGLWAVWSAEVPALSILNSKEMWTTETTVTHEITNEEGVAEQVTETVSVPITYGNALLAAVIGLVGVVLTRNIPGLLEIILSQRLKLAYGERVAVATITRYIITILVVIIAFNTLGIGWGKVQWLVAALSLGIGFGLQEIVANFVSGLILLFERPIRVGDTVTVGGISGTVTRIQIRATTITDWDRKELIVPNKEFITGQLVNWSLSDATLRVVIPVGIDYGADIDLAEETLYRVAREHGLVLEDPAPSVYFKGFGDSTLNFDLRVYCTSIDDFVPVSHGLHKAITKAFRQAGISIAFPQQDLHIVSADGLKGIFLPPTGPADPPPREA